MLNFLRLLRGILIFQVSDGYIEHFINIAGKQRISIWDTKRHGNTLTAKSTITSLKKLQSVAQKSGVKLTVTKQYGLPVFLNKYKNRKGLLVTGIFALFLPIILSNFIMKIEIIGNDIIPTHVILQKLKEQGVSIGTFRYTIDPQDVERQIIISDSHFTWAALNIKGCTATLLVRETLGPTEILDVQTPFNVVASHNGFIVEMQPYEGQSQVKVGDSVQQGQLLVSGIREDVNQKTRLVHARARVIAQVSDQVNIEIPYTRENTIYSGYTEKKLLTIGGIQLTLSGSTPEQNYKLESATSDMPILGLIFPIGITTEKHLLTSSQNSTITEEDALVLAEKQIQRIEDSFPLENSIVSKDLQGQDMGNCFLVTVNYQRYIDIAQETEILQSS